MSDQTMGDTGESRRNIGAHPSPQVHLLVDSMKVTGWQASSVRVFLSKEKRNQSLKIESTKTEAGDRVNQLGR